MRSSGFTRKSGSEDGAVKAQALAVPDAHEGPVRLAVKIQPLFVSEAETLASALMGSSVKG